MMEAEINVAQFDAIMKRLTQLGPQLQKGAIRRAGTKAMRIVRDAARNSAPVRSGKLRKEIVTRNNARRGRQIGGAVIQVGVRGGAKQYQDNSRNRRMQRVGQSYEGGGNVFYWRFLEFGTKYIRARPFMRPALANNVTAVTDTFANELEREIQKALQAG